MSVQINHTQTTYNNSCIDKKKNYDTHGDCYNYNSYWHKMKPLKEN